MQPFFLHNRDLFETREKKVSLTTVVIRQRGNVLKTLPVQNIPLVGLYWGTGYIRNTVSHHLRHFIFRMLVLHGWFPC